MLLSNVDTRFIRYLHDRIDWQARLVAILGSRGVDKTTLMLQHIKLHDNPKESLYVMADDFYFSQHRLDLALQLYQQGGKRLYIDEIHKYKGWSVEIKNIYDKIPNLHVVYTGSSILEPEKSGADLSRRKLEYKLAGLSLREYINLSQGTNLQPYSLKEILEGTVEFPMNDIRPLQQFATYLRKGFYPFFPEGNYHLRLNGILKQVVEFDIPQFADFNIASVQKLKSLLTVLAESVPFKPNYSKLERDLDISRNALPTYMHLLEKAGLISLLHANSRGLKRLEKIDKVYLQNPNIAHILSPQFVDKGTLRETIFFAWLSEAHQPTASPVSDFEVDGLTFEVGGSNKGAKQLSTVDPTKAYVVRDDIEYPALHHIPLWQFGMLY